MTPDDLPLVTLAVVAGAIASVAGLALVLGVGR